MQDSAVSLGTSLLGNKSASEATISLLIVNQPYRAMCYGALHAPYIPPTHLRVPPVIRASVSYRYQDMSSLLLFSATHAPPRDRDSEPLVPSTGVAPGHVQLIAARPLPLFPSFGPFVHFVSPSPEHLPM